MMAIQLSMHTQHCSMHHEKHSLKIVSSSFGPLLLTWFNRDWDMDKIASYCFMSDVITHSYSDFNGGWIKVKAWMNNYILQFSIDIHVIIYTHLNSNAGVSLLVKEPYLLYIYIQVYYHACCNKLTVFNFLSNSLRPRQNRRHSAYDIFKLHFLASKYIDFDQNFT